MCIQKIECYPRYLEMGIYLDIAARVTRGRTGVCARTVPARDQLARVVCSRYPVYPDMGLLSGCMIFIRTVLVSRHVSGSELGFRLFLM